MISSKYYSFNNNVNFTNGGKLLVREGRVGLLGGGGGFVIWEFSSGGRDGIGGIM